MLTCQFKGGLGNQLFQIAATLALAWDNDDTYAFNSANYIKLTQGYNPKKYKSNIYSNLNFVEDIVSSKIYQEPFYNYQKIPYSSNLCLSGFFQSEEYFKHYKSRIIDLFKPNLGIKTLLYNKYKNILDRPNCAIHVRRGDYSNLSNYNYILDNSYYLNAVKQFDKTVKFLVFSDDINWCKTNLNCENFIFINNNDILDFYLMSICKNQIIANSTYSWWASYLNSNSYKTVIAPRNWFNVKYNTNDLYTSYMFQL